MPASTELDALLRDMRPVLNPGVYVYAYARPGKSVEPSRIVASIRESEGLSLILEESVAEAEGLEPELRCAWITLTVNSDLAAVGFTAVFSAALANAGISCNVVAGVRHDHIFVPSNQADLALRTLMAIRGQEPGHR